MELTRKVQKLHSYHDGKALLRTSMRKTKPSRPPATNAIQRVFVVD
jgi:hypothetical protein